jgi:hypothetical protein
VRSFRATSASLLVMIFVTRKSICFLLFVSYIFSLLLYYFFWLLQLLYYCTYSYISLPLLLFFTHQTLSFLCLLFPFSFGYCILSSCTSHSLTRNAQLITKGPCAISNPMGGSVWWISEGCMSFFFFYCILFIYCFIFFLYLLSLPCSECHPINNCSAVDDVNKIICLKMVWKSVVCLF